MYVCSGIQNADWSGLLNWLSEEMSYACENGDTVGFAPISDVVITRLNALIVCSTPCPPSEVQYHVLFFLENEWQRFTETAKSEIFQTIVASFACLSDMRCKFIIVELLGRFFADRKALLALKSFSEDGSDDTRQLAAVGIAQFVRHTSDMQSKSKATDLLRKLTEDHSRKVRNEAIPLLHTILTSRSKSRLP